MIRKFKIVEIDGDLPAVAKGSTFLFGEGLNIVVGPNGVGKTTLLGVLAAWAGGASIAHSTWSQPLHPSYVQRQDHRRRGYPAIFRSLAPRDAKVALEWDGAPTFASNLEADESRAKAVIGGSSTGRMMEDMGFSPTSLLRGSAGERTLKAHVRIQERLGGVPDLDGRLAKARKTLASKRATAGDIEEAKAIIEYCEYAGSCRELFHGGGKKGAGRPLLIIDEPDRGLSLLNQVSLFESLRELACTWQIIVSTHSPVALALAADPSVTIVDLGEAGGASSARESARMMASLAQSFEKAATRLEAAHASGKAGGSRTGSRDRHAPPSPRRSRSK